MSYRTRTAALVAALVVAVLAPFASASPSQAGTRPKAEDTSPWLFTNCISYSEYMNAGITGTMRDTEAYFGATGRVVSVADHGTTLIKQYKWCGYSEGAVMVQIAYYLNKRGQWIAQFAAQYDYRDDIRHHPSGRTI